MGFFDGIFNNNQNQIEKSRIEKLIDYYKEHTELTDSDDFLEFLQNRSELWLKTMDEETLCDVIDMMIAKDKPFFDMNLALPLYKVIVFNPESQEEKKIFLKFFELYLNDTTNCRKDRYGNRDSSFLDSMLEFERVYNTFKDKKLILAIYRYLTERLINKEEFDYALQYIKTAKSYYVSEEAFYASVINFINEMDKVVEHMYDDIFIKRVRDDKKAAGIYDIDEASIIKLEATFEDLKSDIYRLDRKKDFLNGEITNLSSRLDERSELLIKNRANEINRVAKEALESIRNLLVEGKIDRKNEINHLEILENSLIDKIKQIMDLSDEEASFVKQTFKDGLSININTNKKSSSSEGKENVEVREGESILSRNDMSLKEKFIYVKSRKESSSLYHKTFDKIVKEVILNRPVMIVGPAGSGKTETVMQLADLLNIKCYNLGFIVDEHEAIKGYNDANSNFVETGFYECFKYGGICLFDEIDNSESKALTEINKIVSGSGYNPYLFSNGELVYPHSDFRIIATSNTWGDGADSLHSTREKLDPSTVDRFSRIFYDYDGELDKGILGSYEDWYNFTVLFRESVKSRNIDKIISTRTFAGIREHLDSEMFSYDEILDIYFVNGMRSDTLKSIYLDIRDNINAENVVMDVFKKIIEEGKVLKR